MKQFDFFLFAILLVGTNAYRNNLPKRVPGVLISSHKDLFSEYPQQTCNSGKKVICKSCSSYSVCLNGQEIANQNCGTDAPNCVQKATGDYCSPTVDDKFCEANAEQFSCTAVGVFPDPKVCQEYHHCMAIGSKSFRYKCPPGYHFDLNYDDTDDDGNYCMQGMYPYECGKVYCNVKFNDGIHSVYGYVDEHGNDIYNQRKYYGLCSNSNGINQILMFKCSKRAILKQNSNGYYRIADCCYDCEDEGKFSNSNDPSTYYLCYSDPTGSSSCSGSSYTYEIRNCPKGYHFNEKTGFCDIKAPSSTTTTTTTHTTIPVLTMPPKL